MRNMVWSSIEKRDKAEHIAWGSYVHSSSKLTADFSSRFSLMIATTRFRQLPTHDTEGVGDGEGGRGFTNQTMEDQQRMTDVDGGVLRKSDGSQAMGLI
jgi:hypothetical protein